MKLTKEFKKWMKARYYYRMNKIKDIRDKIDSDIRKVEEEIE